MPRARAAEAVIHTVHQQHVPHTSKTGKVLTKYDAKESFFTIGSWGQMLPDAEGGPYPDWKELAAAGFNTVWPMNWDDRALPLAEAADLQLVFMGKIDDAHAASLKNHPRLLGNMWMDEPTGQLNILEFNMQELFDSFLSYKKHINQAMPGLPVFINDPPAIFPNPPKFKEWWLKWNTAGDVSCQDDYPIVDRKSRTRSLGAEPTGLPQVVSLAVDSNHGEKPVWTIVAAFHAIDKGWPYRMPSTEQLRTQIYTSIASGTTGVAYFIMDSHASRQGGVVGMSPKPKPSYAPGGFAFPTPAMMVRSKALWEMSKHINIELKELTPALLSPTSTEKYSVTVKGEPPQPKPLHCLLKTDPAGGQVLILANVDDAVLEVSVAMDQPLKQIAPLYENRDRTPPDASGKGFTDHFEPFETHVYRLTPAGK